MILKKKKCPVEQLAQGQRSDLTARKHFKVRGTGLHITEMLVLTYKNAQKDDGSILEHPHPHATESMDK